MIKALLTTGCSFSDFNGRDTNNEHKRWTNYLEEYISPEFVMHTGYGSSGNDIIAKRAIYMCSKALKQYTGDEILLVLNWSEISRKSFFVNKDNPKSFSIEHMKQDIHDDYDNILEVIGCDLENKPQNNEGYFWVSNHWKDSEIQKWYLTYYNDAQALEETVWNMLQVQNFCELNNINYGWMSLNNYIHTADYSKFNVIHLEKMLNPELSIMDMGMWEWTKINNPELFMKDKVHPNPLGHFNITTKCIIPHFQSNGVLL